MFLKFGNFLSDNFLPILFPNSADIKYEHKHLSRKSFRIKKMQSSHYSNLNCFFEKVKRHLPQDDVASFKKLDIYLLVRFPWYGDNLCFINDFSALKFTLTAYLKTEYSHIKIFLWSCIIHKKK